jgi:hypothetical protein
MDEARHLSRKHGTAYAIATRDGKDSGQRVYIQGSYSHTDGQF